jgi:putative membrane protein
MIRNFGYGGFGWIGMILGLVIMIALITGFVILVIWAIRRMSGNSNQIQYPVSKELTAKDIAKARYAKGEISREEYQQLLSDIGN